MQVSAKDKRAMAKPTGRQVKKQGCSRTFLPRADRKKFEFTQIQYKWGVQKVLMVGGCRWFLNFARPTSSPVAGSFFLNFLGPSPLQAFGSTISVVPFLFTVRRHPGVSGIENKNLKMGELFVGTRWIFFRYCKD